MENDCSSCWLSNLGMFRELLCFNSISKRFCRLAYVEHNYGRDVWTEYYHGFTVLHVKDIPTNSEVEGRRHYWDLQSITSISAGQYLNVRGCFDSLFNLCEQAPPNLPSTQKSCLILGTNLRATSGMRSMP